MIEFMLAGAVLFSAGVFIGTLLARKWYINLLEKIQ